MLKPNDTMPIWKKYTGELMKEVYMYDPHYIDWMIEKTDYTIDLEAFKKLPAPKSVKIYDDKLRSGNKLGGVLATPIYYHENQVIRGRRIEKSGEVIPQREFIFSANAIKRNSEKLESER